MSRKLLWVMLLLLVPAMLFAQNGKIRGLITDQETGEPLIGANVTIEGTSLGASSDMTGTYIILAVPPGLYNVRATYIGYQAEVIQQIRVNAGLTTTQDFGLSTTAIRGEELVIVAERPLIQRNTTNTIRMTTEEDIQNIPIRGLQNIVALEAGTVLQDGALHVRGGREGEVAYFVDGATATNVYNNTESINVIQEAVEEIQMQAGGYTAEFGGGNSAVVRTTIRTGGPQFKVSVDYRTDDFVKSGEKFLGTHSYGYHNFVGSISGPVPGLSKLRFYLAGQFNYRDDDNPSFISPFEFTGLTDDGYNGRELGELVGGTGTISWTENNLPLNWNKNQLYQGTLLFSATDNLKFRLTGSYNNILTPTGVGNFFGNLRNYFNMHRNPMWEEDTYMGAFRMTHIINEKTFYEISAFGSLRKQTTYDEDFGDNWTANTDSVTNAELGYTGWRSRYLGPRWHSTINNFEMEPYGYPYNGYHKEDQLNYGGSLDFTSQLTSNWEFKVGGRLDMWTMRRFSVGNIRQYMETEFGVDGLSPYDWEAQFGDDADLRRTIELDRQGGVTMYGYDIDGNKTDEEPFGPEKPTFASAYVQNRFEYRDLVLNLGLRYEYVDFKATKPINDEVTLDEMDVDADWLLPEFTEKTKALHYILPRLNFSFPVTDRTVFYALYGKYIQMPRLDRLYQGYQQLSGSVNPTTRSPYGWWGSYVGYTAEPEEIIQYEMGIRQSLTDNFAITLSGFYKDLRNQLRIDRLYLDSDSGDITVNEDRGNIIFCGYVNQDFGTIKGLEFTAELRRTNRLSARINYTFSDARGTNSDSRSGVVVVTDEVIARYPLLMYPLNHNQPHRGTVMLDYRFAKGDGGPILQGLGLNMLFTFNSGHAYTKIEEPKNLGQASPWTVGVDALGDPRTRHPEEPLNASYTPWVYNFDLNINKVFYLGQINLDLYVHVLNLFNTKSIINVYPQTGVAEDDGWLSSPFAAPFYAIPNYVDFYRTINSQNRWAYQNQTGNDVYGRPRQIRAGIRLEFN